MLKASPTALPEVLLLEPKVFGDSRGFFMESYNAKDFALATGVADHFVQDNHSRSSRGVLRGMHYQIKHPQGKLVRVSRGVVFDVVIDLRRHSTRFGQWVGVILSEENQQQLWVPPGFAHGFLVLSEFADFQYKTTDYWYPEHERSVLWRDQAIGVRWPEYDPAGVPIGQPKLAAKDADAKPLADAEVFP